MNKFKLFGNSDLGPTTTNRAVEQIELLNATALERAHSFQQSNVPYSEKFKDFLLLKHQVPYFGFVPCRAGNVDFVLFHANDDIVAWEYFWFGRDGYEREIVQTWLEWCDGPNMVLDIGAYSGLMSILAALSDNKTSVTLFEPMDRTIERAKINILANGIGKQVKLHNQAASDHEGSETIYMPRNQDFLGTGNSLMDKGNAVASRLIECTRLDVALPNFEPTIVKIDVEGHELACLRGMATMIKRSRPKIIIEVWNHTRKEVLELLTSWGYGCTPFEKQERKVMNYQCVAV